MSMTPSATGRSYPVRRSIRKPEEAHLRGVTLNELRGVARTGDLWVSGHVPPIWDQGQEGSCTAHGNGRAYEIQRRTQGLPPMDPSRALLYDLERMLEGTALTDDAGAQVPDGPAVLTASGCCDTSDYPYTAADLTTPPTPPVLAAAALHKVGSWARVSHTPADIIAMLAQGFAVPFGFDVYESFESSAVAQTGVVPVPQHGEQLLGGHCMCITGWNITALGGPHADGLLGWFMDRLEGSVPEDGYFLVDNSWGTGWGITGRCQFPFEMFRRGFAFDPLVISHVLG